MITRAPDGEIIVKAADRWVQLQANESVKGRRFQEKSCFLGVIAEITVLHWSDFYIGDGIKYDLTKGPMRLELKTSIRNINPRPSDTAKIPANYLAHAEASGITHLLFASINRMTLLVTLCGFISIDEFKRQAKCYLKGEIPEGDDKPRNCDTYQIEYRHLRQPKTYKGKWSI